MQWWIMVYESVKVTILVCVQFCHRNQKSVYLFSWKANLEQRVLNAAARLVLNLRPRDHVTPALQKLHWLPIDYRITYKLCLIMHLVHTERAPRCLSDSVQILQHSCLRPAEVQNQVRRARLLSCWTYCMEQSSTPSPSYLWHWSFQAPPQNWTIS